MLSKTQILTIQAFLLIAYGKGLNNADYDPDDEADKLVEILDDINYQEEKIANA